MPANLSGLDNIIANWDTTMRDQMGVLAENGEMHIRQNAQWDDDTGSLRASVTGFEAKTGDPHANESDPEWVTARIEGNINGRHKYVLNPPENYEPVSDTRDVGEADNPTAVIAAMVWYGEDDPIAPFVRSSFEDGLNSMQSEFEQILVDGLRMLGIS